MASRQLLFKMFYRLGFVPWDGHPLAISLQELIDGEGALAPGTALDLGCGTGDNSIYLAEHGWQVTGVDFVAKAVHKARAKAEATERRAARDALLRDAEMWERMAAWEDRHNPPSGNDLRGEILRDPSDGGQ